MTTATTMLWQKEVPYDTRDQAISDCLIAFKSAFSNLRNKNIKSFKVKYRTKKHGCQSFKVNPKALDSCGCIFKQRLKKKGKLRMRNSDIKDFLNNGDITDGFFTILKTKSGCWYICLPRTKITPIFEEPSYKSVFLDPGVRTFQTFYSPEGICGKIGDGFREQLKPLANRHDNLQSVKDKTKNKKTKKHITKRCTKIREKIQNKVRDLHTKTCKFLCDNFENIFIPSFEVSSMVEGSPLGSKTTRQMLMLSHGYFKDRLLTYSKTKMRNVYVVKEGYTTKTCGHCGNEEHVGSNKTFKCSKCNIQLDRDYNGARNISLLLVSHLI
jgi:putative transposase